MFACRSVRSNHSPDRVKTAYMGGPRMTTRRTG
jgi:hypothetical protein